MKVRIAILCLLLSSPSVAGNLQIHLGSSHASGCDECNEENFGFGYRGDGKYAFTGGYYTNSWFRDSWYAGLNIKANNHISLSLVGVTGYTGTSDGIDNFLLFGEVLPVPMVHWRMLDTKVSPLLTYAPTPDGGVALLSVSYGF